jgi:hypothetical protein
VDSAERAEENRSSAWTLTLVGGIGLIVIILNLLNVIHLPFSGFNKYMVSGLMGALFIIFIIAGIISVKKTKTYSKAANVEKDNKAKIIEWCKENDIANQIDMAIENQFPDLPVEELYFRRYEGLKFYVFKNFESMSLPFLEHVIDEIYDSLFED